MLQQFSVSSETLRRCLTATLTATRIWVDLPVLRENSLPIDFIGFLGSRASCSRHENFAHDSGPTVSQSARLHVVQPVGRDPDSRAQTAAQRVQAEVEEAAAEKQVCSGSCSQTFGGTGHRS